MNYDNNNNFNNGYNMNQRPPVQPMQQMPNNQPNGNLYDFSNDINTNNNVSSNGYSNENVEFKSSKKKRFSFFALLEFLIIVFLCLYIANDKGYIHIKFLDNLIPVKEQKQEENKEEEKKEEKKEESTITDNKTVAEFKLRAYYLGNIGVSFEKLVSPVFSKNTKASDLTPADRLHAILMGALTVESKYESLTDAAAYQELFPDLAANTANDMSVIKVIDSSFIESRYKLVFGENPTNTNLEDTCPHFVYSEKYKKYYINPYCGNVVVNESINQFAYKVTSDGEKFYVYISVATYKQNEDGSVSVYKDPGLTEKYKDFATEAEYTNFEINSSNYNEFSKYKITFVKNGEEYAFSSLDKVTEEGSKGIETKEQ